MSDGYRISVLRKEVRDRIFAAGRESQCTKVWEGERCLLLAPHDDKECIIPPPATPLAGETGRGGHTDD